MRSSFFEKQIHRPLRVGTKQITIHLVDLDTKELVAGWLVTTSSAAPVVSRTYDVDVTVGKSAHKKIAYVNKWDRARNFRYVKKIFFFFLFFQVLNCN